MEFIELLKVLLNEERGHTREDAERLVKSYPSIVTKGIMTGNFALRATAMALEMADAGKEREDAIPAESEEEVRKRFANWNLVQELMQQEQLDEWEDYVRHCKGAPISSIRPWDSSSLGGNDQDQRPPGSGASEARKTL